MGRKVDMKALLLDVCQVFQDNRDYLCKMDSFTGDGDHGISMDRGFRAVQEELATLEVSDWQYVKRTGRVLTSTIGGAIGPLMGMIFTEASKVFEAKDTIDTEAVYLAADKALSSIKRLGRVKEGDKTMVDALSPAVQALKDAGDRGTEMEEALDMAVEAARQGLERTKDMVAVKGRAKFLGERSKGYQDAGATSMCLLLEAIRDHVKKQKG